VSLVIPNTFVAGSKARASEVNANFTAVSAKFTEGAGGISDGDVSSAAGIKNTKLSTVSGNRITQAQLEDDAVDLRVLRDDATAGSPNAAVNTADHIKDGIITKAKLTTTAGSRITKAQTEIVVQTQLVTFSGLVTGVAQVFSVTPTPAISKATNAILGTYMSGISNPTGFQAISIQVDTTDPTNYLFKITVLPSFTGSFTGNLVVSFLPAS
jgi:hypothetical protein